MTSHTVPKSLRRVSDQYQGMPVKYVGVLVTAAVLAMIFIIGAISTKGTIIFVVLLFFEAFIFGKFMRSPDTLDRSWLSYQFFMRSIRGQTVFAKYALPAAFMQTIIPIKEIYENGLILFSQNHYGMLLRADPARISDDDLEMHINQVRNLTDSLHGELMVKSYVCSLPTGTKGVRNGLQSLLNESGRTKEEQEHIYSLWEKSIENKAPVVEWRFFIFVGFGKYPNLEEAEIAAKQYYPGITERLLRANMHITPIIDRNELGRTYRQLVNQEVT